jgi:hypothetical protein
MKTLFKCCLVIVLFSGCAKIPVSSVVLANALQIEGERMHKLNILLIDRVFSAKRMAIEKFITDEYAPAAIENFLKIVPPATDFKKDFKELMAAINPEINSRRDSLLGALEIQRVAIIARLNEDYKVFNDAATSLQNLLESATKIEKEKQALFAKAKELSKNQIDFNKVETALDKFITTGGNVGTNIISLNNDINQIINH